MVAAIYIFVDLDEPHTLEIRSYHAIYLIYVVDCEWSNKGPVVASGFFLTLTPIAAISP